MSAAAVCNLLKRLMEETGAEAFAQRHQRPDSGHDGFQPAEKGPASINTRHILFIVSGAFDGLEKFV